MLDKLKYESYIEERINHYFYSQKARLQFDVTWYFEKRNTGMAGVGPDEVRLLCQKAVRDLRVIKEMEKRCS